MKPINTNLPKTRFRLATTLISASFALVLSACGGGYNLDGEGEIDGTDTEIDISLASYALPGLNKVVLQIENIRFQRSGQNDIIIEEFSGPTLTDTELTGNNQTLTLNLAGIRPSNNAVQIVEDFTIKSGHYDSVVISISDDNTNHSYVTESGAADTRLPLSARNRAYTLQNVTVSSGSNRHLILDLGLRQSLFKNTSTNGYELAEQGGLNVEKHLTTSIDGSADLTALYDLESCANKAEPAVGNRVYLYRGANISRSRLQDMNNREASSDDKKYPYAVAPVDSEGNFKFYFLPAESYTLAYSCLAEGDTKNTDDSSVIIPSPTSQYTSFSQGSSQNRACRLPIVEELCQ